VIAKSTWGVSAFERGCIMKPNRVNIILALIIILLFFVTGVQEGRIARAELRVAHLEKTAKWVRLLEQILPEEAKDDLDLLSEELGEGG
jgi:hypothetical protein